MSTTTISRAASVAAYTTHNKSPLSWSYRVDDEAVTEIFDTIVAGLAAADADRHTDAQPSRGLRQQLLLGQAAPGSSRPTGSAPCQGG